ncbi:hypothetical protein HanPI659440_Chr16g0658981 [Helianthus annuus]|nr:hypothetical protein HanPI659440_Chr16g0658981 [Helianthus annuus]
MSTLSQHVHKFDPNPTRIDQTEIHKFCVRSNVFITGPDIEPDSLPVHWSDWSNRFNRI